MALKDFFVEKVNDTNDQAETDDTEMYYSEEECMEEPTCADVSDQTSNDLIQNIYEKNCISLPEAEKNGGYIFKVEEVMKSLPNEMPTDTKKASAVSILNGAMSLDIGTLINDGFTRIKILGQSQTQIIEAQDAIIVENEQRIESLKKEIADLEKNNQERKQEKEDCSDIIEEESDRIASIINFIGQEELK